MAQSVCSTRTHARLGIPRTLASLAGSLLDPWLHGSSRSRWAGPGLVRLTLVMLALLPPSAQAQEIHGFVEALNGVRTDAGSGFETRSYTARETRLQLKISDFSETAEYFARLDYFFDQIQDENSDLELREAFLTYTGFGFMDFKIGRQIMTWGTGDLLFINDVFPKDWQSFFIGREDQYLKAPMDAVRLGLYGSAINLNVIAVPRFEPDRLPQAERLAFFNPLGGVVEPVQPKDELEDGELALRAYRNIGSLEIALYGYFGYYRQPVGFDTRVMRPVYPRLHAYGASLRRGLLGGVGNAEFGYYDSRNDRDGIDPTIKNSSLQWMLGYDRQLWTDFQLGLQGFHELMLDYDDFISGLAPGAYEPAELRQLYTVRLTKLMKYQTVKLSLFTFVSPTDEDLYMRAMASYKLSDPVELALGANFFSGAHTETLFGQLDDNDNVYLRARYSF